VLEESVGGEVSIREFAWKGSNGPWQRVSDEDELQHKLKLGGKGRYRDVSPWAYYKPLVPRAEVYNQYKEFLRTRKGVDETLTVQETLQLLDRLERGESLPW
jgi:hypothetical protein